MALKDRPSRELSRRCTMCALDWPFKDQYRECPQCLGETSPVRGVSPMDDDEARSLAAHANFERYYEEYDATQPPDRLIPGEEEARLVAE